MDANEFMNINADVTFKMLSDDDIICAINKDDNCLSQEKTLLVLRVTDNEALKALNLVKIYFLQQPENL
ncbi:13972_t:CDS:1, partial [Cetraspora pellucida]